MPTRNCLDLLPVSEQSLQRRRGSALGPTRLVHVLYETPASRLVEPVVYSLDYAQDGPIFCRNVMFIQELSNAKHGVCIKFHE